LSKLNNRTLRDFLRAVMSCSEEVLQHWLRPANERATSTRTEKRHYADVGQTAVTVTATTL